MAKITGGSGKSYTVSSNGAITVTSNGKTHTVTPDLPIYKKTQDAMHADTGKGKYSGSSSSSSNKGSSSSSSSSNKWSSSSSSNKWSSSSSSNKWSSSSSSNKGSSSSSSNKGSSSSPSSAAKPQYWKPGPGDDKTKYTAIIKDSDGTIIATHQTYAKDGAMYDATTGKILSSNHGVQGEYGDPKYFDKHYDPVTGVGTWTAKPQPPVYKPNTSGGGSYRPKPKPPARPPARPSFIKFNEPIPSFNSDLKKVTKIAYFSGIDKLEAKHVETNPEVCFISKSIPVGTLKEEEYIELFAKYYADDNASVEFYILDGEIETPILPINDTTIKNEKIFFEMDTRFPIDTSQSVFIKQGTKATNLSFEEANKKATDSKMENTYNISYTPKTSHKYKPLNPTIKIKVIIRAYALNHYSPYIKSIKIRKYGGNALWNQDL